MLDIIPRSNARGRPHINEVRVSLFISKKYKNSMIRIFVPLLIVENLSISNKDRVSIQFDELNYLIIIKKSEEISSSYILTQVSRNTFVISLTSDVLRKYLIEGTNICKSSIEEEKLLIFLKK